MNSERNLNAWVVRTRTNRKIVFNRTTHDVRTSKGRASLDAEMLRLLRNRSKDWSIGGFVQDQTNYYRTYHSYDRNMKILRESADRLVVAGKLLPIVEKTGYLIPCR